MLETSCSMELLLNMQMLVDDLEELCNVRYFVRRNDSQKLKYAEAYYGQKELDDSVVYVGSAEMFDRHPISDKRICRIMSGASKHKEEEAGCCLIEVEDGIRWEELLNQVQRIFWRYQSWAYRLQMILNSGGSLYELCVAAMDFFKNPLYIHDADFNVLAMPTWVVGMSDFIVDETTGNKMVPLEKVQYFHVSREYIKTLSTRGAQMWNPSYNSHRVLYVNIWAENQTYYGRFLINELGVSLKPGNFTMAEYFVRILTLAMERDMLKSSSRINFESILQKLCEGEKVDSAYLLNRLKMVGWKQNQTYQCFMTRVEQPEASLVIGKRLSSTVGILLKQSFSFNRDNQVFTVCNLSLSGYSQEECRRLMLDLQELSEVVIGASNPFSDFLLIEEYFRQARKSIDLGKRKNPGESYYLFADYALDYIITHFTEEFEAGTVGSQAVQKLKLLDEEKHTDYLKTLKCYFDNNCQQTLTAQAMFIHRSTLTYRLERIQKITGVDLDDADTRLYMQISMRLLA